METFIKVIEVAADVLTIASASIALYVLWKHRGKISRFANAIINYSARLSLNELAHLVEDLRKCTLSTDDAYQVTRKTLGEIKGQVQGSMFLPLKIRTEIVQDIVTFVASSSRDEHELQTLAGKIRAQIRSIDSSMYLNDEHVQ